MVSIVREIRENLPRLARLPVVKRRGSDSNSAPNGTERFPSRANKKMDTENGVHFFGDPWENRTPVSALRGPCLSRLTNGPSRLIARLFYHIFFHLSIGF